MIQKRCRFQNHPRAVCRQKSKLFLYKPIALDSSNKGGRGEGEDSEEGIVSKTLYCFEILYFLSNRLDTILNQTRQLFYNDDESEKLPILKFFLRYMHRNTVGKILHPGQFSRIRNEITISRRKRVSKINRC